MFQDQVKLRLCWKNLLPALASLNDLKPQEKAKGATKKAKVSQNEGAVTYTGTLPDHVVSIEAEGFDRANLIDANPIGTNVRSTVATYSGVLDDLRKSFAVLPESKEKDLKAGAFSYNTGSLRCLTCDGTGQISLDVQFLPDVDIPCPDCHGSRYGSEAYTIKRLEDTAKLILCPELLSLTIDEALEATKGLKRVQNKLQVLHDLGLGYLTLGEATPASFRRRSSTFEVG